MPSQRAPHPEPPAAHNIDYQAVEERIKAGYRTVTAKYRNDDELEVTTENHRRLGGILQNICLSFQQPISVLDVGCGTGRYFHCLRNVVHLVGIDISEEMLEAARSPVLQHEVCTRHIDLLKANTYLVQFPAGSFDFIYSLGMFGHGCPVTVDICEKFFDWLKPGGKLFFNTIDHSGLPLCHRVRRRVRNLIYPWLSRDLKKMLDQREQQSPFFSLTRSQLRAIMVSTRFRNCQISSYACTSPLWTGRHLECQAEKPSPCR